MPPSAPDSSRSAFAKTLLRQWLLLALLTARPVAGEGPREFLIQNWAREDGLPASTVTAVAQTPDGYLWVGTLSGLARFDGVRFVQVDLRRLAAQENSSVFSLYADHQGDLWIGMGDGRLIQLSRREFTSRMPASRQTPDRYIQRISEDGAGGLWTLNYEGSVSRLLGNVFTEVAASPDILALVSDSAGGVWVATRSELLHSAGSRLTRMWADASNFHPESLAPARAGGCWVAGDGCVRRFEGGQLRETRANLLKSSAALSGFLEDRDGRLWLGSYGRGIGVYDKDGTMRRLSREEGLPSDLVRCLFEDREGNLWAGLEAKGLIRIRHALFASYAQTAGMSDETALCVSEDKEGDIWIGTNGDGVHRVSKNGQVRHYGIREGLTNQFVWSLQPDHAGSVWAGTWGAGLFRLESERFVSPGPEFSSMPVVLGLFEDRRGALWLGQRTGPERVVAALETNHLCKLTVPGELARLEIRRMAETSDGSMWFGTMEEGLLRWKDGQFTRYDSLPGPAGAIGALHVDNSGALWVAGEQSGLARWENERFIMVVAAEALPDRNLVQLTDDGLGYLWCASENGIFRVKMESLRRPENGRGARLNWQRFTKADGLPSDSCNGGGCRTRDGRIWFATLTGAAVLDPRQAPASQAPPRVLIEEVFLADQRIFDGGGLFGTNAVIAPRTRSASAPSQPASTDLKIPPGRGPVDIGYTALNLAAPKRVRFRYELAGLDAPPVESGSARLVRYNYLPPGKYEFRVTACVEGGDWNDTGDRLAFEVLPHYWQTWWFRDSAITAFGMVVAAAVTVVLRLRHRRRIEQLERIHALERERARIARDIHDDLGGSLTEITLLGALAAREGTPPAETRGQVARIVDRANELTRKLDEIVWVVNPKNDSVAKLPPYLCQFAREFMEPTGITCRFEVQDHLPGAALSAEARHNLYLVLKEALNNCVRHSGATRIQLSLACSQGCFVMEIQDDGAGFSLPSVGTDGNGLRNMRQRAEAIGALLSVLSNPSQGTTVRLSLPLNGIVDPV